MPIVSQAIQNMEWLPIWLTGGGDGIVGGYGNEGAVTQQSPLALAVDVDTFAIVVAEHAYKSDAVVAVTGFTAPVSNPRIDGTVGTDERLFLSKVLSQVDIE